MSFIPVSVALLIQLLLFCFTVSSWKREVWAAIYCTKVLLLQQVFTVKLLLHWKLCYLSILSVCPSRLLLWLSTKATNDKNVLPMHFYDNIYFPVFYHLGRRYILYHLNHDFIHFVNMSWRKYFYAPFRRRRAYCFAHVGMSASPKPVQPITGEHLQQWSLNWKRLK